MNILDRLLMHPVLDCLAQAFIGIFSIGMLVLVFSCFWWG